MSDLISLRGYAAPFHEIGWLVDDGSTIEYFDRGAFDAQISSSRPVFLNFGTHSAPAITDRVELFIDNYGLAMCALVGLRDWVSMCHGICQSGVDHLSIYMSRYSAERRRLTDGRMANVVTSASIEHICVCNDAAYGGTKVWPGPEVSGERPASIRRLDAQWVRGRAAYLGAKSRARIDALDALAAKSRSQRQAPSQSRYVLTPLTLAGCTRRAPPAAAVAAWRRANSRFS